MQLLAIVCHMSMGKPSTNMCTTKAYSIIGIRKHSWNKYSLKVILFQENGTLHVVQVVFNGATMKYNEIVPLETCYFQT